MVKYLFFDPERFLTPSTLTNTEQIVHALNNTTTEFVLHPSTVAVSGLSIAAMFEFVPRLMMGFRKG